MDVRETAWTAAQVGGRRTFTREVQMATPPPPAWCVSALPAPPQAPLLRSPQPAPRLRSVLARTRAAAGQALRVPCSAPAGPVSWSFAENQLDSRQLIRSALAAAAGELVAAHGLEMPLRRTQQLSWDGGAQGLLHGERAHQVEARAALCAGSGGAGLLR